jgi:hypothetical protein
VEGSGTTEGARNYSFTDDEAPSGPCYYRLSQTDYNGTRKSFRPVEVNGLNDFSVQKVFPNPATDQLNVTINQEGGSDVTISVMDMVGRCVYKADKHLDNASNLIQIALGDYPGGMYMVMITGNYRTFQSKFVKQ